MRSATIFFILLSGCSTISYKGLDDRVQSWIGKTEDELVSALGVPTSVYEAPGGTKVIEFNVVDGKTAVVTGYGEVQSYSRFCKTKYVVGASKIIERASWEGNNCPKTRTAILSDYGL